MAARGILGLAVAIGALACAPAAFAAADLSVSRDPFPSVAGEESGSFGHTYRITNNGPDPASGTFVLESGPVPAISTTSGSSGGGSTNTNGSDPRRPVMTFSGVPSGASVLLGLGFASDHPLTQTTRGTLTPSTPDPNLANNVVPSTTTRITGLTISAGAFGDHLLGTTATKTFTVTNGASTGVVTGTETFSGAPDFGVGNPGTCGAGTLVNTGSTCTFTAAFRPRVAGDRSAIVAVVPRDGPVDPAVGLLSGRGTTGATALQSVLPDTADPVMTLSRIGKTIKRRTLRKKGLRFKVTGNEPIAIDAELLAAPRRIVLKPGVREARRFNLTLAESVKPLGTGRRTIRLKPPRSLLKARRFKLHLALTATDAAGNTTTKTRTIKVR
jgi:hypothetical protein